MQKQSKRNSSGIMADMTNMGPTIHPESHSEKESSGQMDEQHGDSLIDAYALGALEPEDVAFLEAHLEQCTRCQQLVADARATSQMMLYSAPLVEPPPGLRAKVLARVHAEATQRGSVPASQPAYADVKTADQGWDRVRRFVRGLFGPVPLPQSDPAAALLSDLLAAPDSVIWDLAGTNDAPGAKARLVGKRNGREAVIVASGLRHLAADEAYQVWFLRGGKPLPNALFTVAGGGQGHQIVRAPSRLRDFEVVAITPEPATGSPAPTGPIVLMGELSA